MKPEDPVLDMSRDELSKKGRGCLVTLGLWALAVMLLVIAAVLVVARAMQPRPPMAQVRRDLANVETIDVQPEEYVESLLLPAKLEADRSAAVTSELAGRLQTWEVAEGQAVQAGQPVATVNTDDLLAKKAELEAMKETARLGKAVAEKTIEVARLSLQRAEKDVDALRIALESAQSDLEYARKDSDRVTKLAEEDIATDAEMDGIRNRLTRARLAVANAEESVKRAEVDVAARGAQIAEAEGARELAAARITEAERAIAALEVTIAKAVIRAPLAGRFEEHLVQPGEVVSPGRIMGMVYDLTYLRAQVDVPDRYVPFLDTTNPLVQAYVTRAMPGAIRETGATVLIPGLPKLTGGHYRGIELAAEIDRVAQAADDAGNTFRVELRLENPGEALKQGILAQARIDFLRYPDAIVIPLKAIRVSDVGPRVLVLNETEDGKTVAVIRDIEPASIKGDRVLVKSGVAAGERLIVTGGKGVLDGEEVRVVVTNGKPTAIPENGEVVTPFMKVTPEGIREAIDEDAAEEAGGG